MHTFLKIASLLDNVGNYKLADKLTKLAIDPSDLDFDAVYKNPETLSDFVLTKSRKENREPVEILGDEKFTVDPSKDPMEQLEERSRGTRRHFALYPQIILFPESGVWKFFFIDPLSLKALGKGTDKEGNLITDQLSIPGLENMYSEEEDAEIMSHEVVYTTNLTLEDTTTKEAIKKVRERFPDSNVDVVFGGIDDREFFDEEKDIEL